MTNKPSEAAGEYRPEVAFRNGKARPEQKLGDLRNETLGIFAIIPQNMLSNSRVTDNHKIPRPGGQSINGSIHIHPFEQRKEQRAAQELRHVFELSGGNGYAGIILGQRERPGDRGEPVRAHPGTTFSWFRVIVGKTCYGEKRKRESWRERGGFDAEGGRGE